MFTKKKQKHKLNLKCNELVAIHEWVVSSWYLFILFEINPLVIYLLFRKCTAESKLHNVKK